MTNTFRPNFDFTKYEALQAEAKKLRSAARRAEAKSDFETAMRLREQVEGIKVELHYMR